MYAVDICTIGKRFHFKVDPPYYGEQRAKGPIYIMGVSITIEVQITCIIILVFLGLEKLAVAIVEVSIVTMVRD